MAITKETAVDKIEVVGDYKHLQIRRAVIIKEDGNEISRTAHRVAYEPGSLDDSNSLIDTDISDEDSEVQAVANVVWTDAVKLSWKNHLIAKLPVEE